jgi:clan AA aspartic protease (TIGR02281 family)
MKQAIWVLASMLLFGCAGLPLEGETLAIGHTCDAWSIELAVMDKYPWAGQATVLQETDHLLHVYGCEAPRVPAPPFSAALSSPPPAKGSPAPDGQGRKEVPIERRGDAYYVPVRINDTITLPFLLDTGATDLAIPADVALTLTRAGALRSGDFLGKIPYRMANGSEELSDLVAIREVRVGEYVVRDVTASITPPEGKPLLGQSFLSKFGAVTVDYKRLVLTLSR